MMGRKVQYKPEIALGHLLTIAAGIVSLMTAYYIFVADTHATFAVQAQQIKQHDKAIEELQTVLKTLPTEKQLMYIESNLKEMKADVSWLVRQQAGLDKPNGN